MRNTEIFTSRGPAIVATTAISSKSTDREGGVKSPEGYQTKTACLHSFLQAGIIEGGYIN